MIGYSEISKNSEMIMNNNRKNPLPLYGIVSLILVLIGAIVVSINFNSISVSFSMPILISSVIVAGEGIGADIVRGTAIVGLIIGIGFLLISLSPIFQFITVIFIH